MDGRAGHYERKLETKAGEVSCRRHYRGAVGHAGELGHRLAADQEIYRHIEAWRNREIVGDFPYVYLDGVILKRS